MQIKDVEYDCNTGEMETIGRRVQEVFRKEMTEEADRRGHRSLGIEEQISQLREFLGELSNVLLDKRIITPEEWGKMMGRGCCSELEEWKGG